MITIAISLTYIVLGLCLVLLAKLVQDILTPYKIDNELVTRDNPALSVSFGGYMLGTVLIFVAACRGEFAQEPENYLQLVRFIGKDVAYAIAGILALNLGRLILDKVALPHFSSRKEIIEDRNVGMGAVEFGSFVATALTIGGAITGTVGGPLEALVFFVLGQLALCLLVVCYEKMVPYSVHGELEKDNVAAGISLAGVMISFGIILAAGGAGVGAGLHQDGVGFDWPGALSFYGVWLVAGLVALTFIRLVIDRVLLPHRPVALEISEDQNVGVAWVEAVTTVGMTLLIVAML
jgi:uncharacterized membrane protein YjfL (UPF0719 family)